MHFCDRDGDCATCQMRTSWTLFQKPTAAGSVYFCWVCDQCGRKNPAGGKDLWIPHNDVQRHLSESEICGLPLLTSQPITTPGQMGLLL